MESHDAGAGDGGSLGSLLQAVLEAIGEGVVVLDDNARVAYASRSARGMLRELEQAAATEEAVLAGLLEHGGRRVPLQLGSRVLGEAIFLGPAAAGAASLAERERRAILETLQATGGRLTAAARHLGISRTTLWRRLRAYGVRRP